MAKSSESVYTYAPTGPFNQEEVDNELVLEIFGRLDKNETVVFAATSEGASNIVVGVIHHRTSFPLQNVEARTTINRDTVKIAVGIQAPLTNIQLSYGYRTTAQGLSLCDMQLRTFKTPPFLGGSIKGMIMGAVQSPEGTIEQSLNKRALDLGLERRARIESMSFSYNDQQTITTLRRR